MDTALKHRLTGAVILVLLAVLLLPELLTGSGESQSSRSSVASSSGSTDRSFNIDLAQGAANPLVVAPPLATDAVPNPPATPLNLPVPPAAVAPPPVAVAPPSAAVAPPPVAVAPPSAAVAPPPAAAQPAPAAPSADAFYVQLGVFVNRASATNLATKLKTSKFPVNVDEIRRDDRVLHRVRVGPVADRPAANALLKRLADAGHAGSVVN